ncbi:MAG: hypothetical protein AAGD88_01120 [Bacteroidota bacterium]
MLDLSKPLGIHEGITFYGDHEKNNIVYFLPNEVGLVPVVDETGTMPKSFDFFLQIFKEGVAVQGGLKELEDSSGAIMSLGVQCIAQPEKLEKARSKLVAHKEVAEDFFFSPPEWSDGTIDLIVLDETTQEADGENDESFVDSIIGSKKPSLTGGDLKAIFNVRLDRKGASLVASTLQGDRSSLAGVLYELKMKCIRPALDMKIEANLDRCHEKVEHLVSVGAAVSYGSLTLSAKASFDFIKEKLIEDGDIKVDILSQVTDSETKKMIDEMVKEFTDNVMRELFRPMVNANIPNVDILENLGSAGPEIGVAYKFRKKKTFHNKTISVDYRQRSATLKIHNPQAHLWLLGLQIQDNIDRYTKTVNFSDLWRENHLEIGLLHDFEQANNDLLSAEVLVWRKKDGRKTESVGGGFQIPENAQALTSFTLTKDDQEKQKIAWIVEKDEPSGYFYQVKFTYKDNLSNVSTPAEIFSDVNYSSSQDLVIIPEVLVPVGIFEFKYGNIDATKISRVDIFIRAKDGDGNQLEQELLTLSEQNTSEIWKVRNHPSDKPYLEQERHYHFSDGRPTLKEPPVALLDEECIVADPFAFKNVAIIPVITGVPANVYIEILLQLEYQSPEEAFEYSQLFRAKAPDFKLEEITIPVLDKGDTVAYEVTAITIAGDLVQLNKGETTGGPLIIKVEEATNADSVSIRWEGPSPEQEDLDYLRLEFKLQKEDGTEQALEKIEFEGDEVPEPIAYSYEGDGTLFMRQIKRYINGDREKEKFKAIKNKEIIIKP